MTNNKRVSLANSELSLRFSSLTQRSYDIIKAKVQLANVASCLNFLWKPEENTICWTYFNKDEIEIVSYTYHGCCDDIIFKSRELAEKAIEILGEDIIKLAITPIY